MLYRKDAFKISSAGARAREIWIHRQSPNRYRNYQRGARWAAFALVGVLLSHGASAATLQFTVQNLVTNDQAVNSAQITDSALLNAWGIAASASSPFWVGDNGSGVSTLYTVDPLTNAVTKNGLTVTIPGDGSVTGVTFNPGASFNGDRFLFVSEDGTISGWRGALGTTAEILQTASASNVYKGSALATVNGNDYFYAANFSAGTIDVVKGNGAAPNLTGNFTDPGLPSGYAPFDIKLLNGSLFITYALQDALKKDEVAGAGNGFVSKFDLQGNFLGRVGSQGTLNAPWGLALAPASFGAFSGDLLVGNFGDGTISVFDLLTNSFAGQLMGADGTPLTIDGLWALTIGNDGSGGSSQKVYFTAGPNDEADGLFGLILPIPEPMTLAVFGVGLAGIWAIRRRTANARRITVRNRLLPRRGRYRGDA